MLLGDIKPNMSTSPFVNTQEKGNDHFGESDVHSSR